LIKPQSKPWDLLLPNTEYAYNKVPSKTIEVSPFKVVYGINPLSPLDLVPRPLDQKPSVDVDQRVEEIKKVHESVQERINLTYSAQNNKHRRSKAFQLVDLVWVHLRKDRFPTK